MFSPRSPDFLTVDDVTISVQNSACPQAQRIGSRGRFGDTEGPQTQFAAGDSRSSLRQYSSGKPEHNPRTASRMAVRSIRVSSCVIAYKAPAAGALFNALIHYSPSQELDHC